MHNGELDEKQNLMGLKMLNSGVPAHILWELSRHVYYTGDKNLWEWVYNLWDKKRNHEKSRP